MTARIVEEFEALFNAHPNYKKRGWTNIDCPACGDRRKRLGFSKTDTGGFRVFCFNAGCDYNTPSGWEPGSGFGGRIRRLYDLLGGDIRNIPMEERKRNHDGIATTDKAIEAPTVTTYFPESDLPEGSIMLTEATGDKAEAVREYVKGRSPYLLEPGARLVWSWKYPDFVIVPFTNKGKVIGYMGRNIHATAGSERFMQQSPPEYLYRQDTIYDLSLGEYMPVVESPLDALLVNGVATRDNTISENTKALLKLSKRTPILIPDQKKRNEAMPYVRAAEENQWLVSLPDWPYKDVGEAIAQHGVFWALSQVLNAATLDYKMVKFRLVKMG